MRKILVPSVFDTTYRLVGEMQKKLRIDCMTCEGQKTELVLTTKHMDLTNRCC